MLTNVQRRFLGHLLAWRDPDALHETETADGPQDLPLADHLRISNRYEDDWEMPTSLTSQEVAIRLTKDPATTRGGEQVITPAMVDEVLGELDGLAERTETGWEKVQPDDMFAKPVLTELDEPGWAMTHDGFLALTDPTEQVD